jgi:hypothetical protein
MSSLLPPNRQEGNAMKRSRLLFALLAPVALLAGPTLSFAAGGPPKPARPPMAAKPTAAAKSPRHAAARNMVSTGRATVQRGKQSLRTQKDNLMRLIGRAEGLKPQRMQLRQRTIDSHRAYRANPNSATRAAWKANVAAYMPVRQAHETARSQRNSAITRYRLTKRQRIAALAVASRAAPANNVRPPTVARPAIRRQARITSRQGFASASGSPQEIYSNAGLAVRGGGGSGHYDSVPLFREEAVQYLRSASLPDTPSFPSLRRSFRQNAYDDVPSVME